MVTRFMGKPASPRRQETPAERQARLRHEAEVIARGHADIDAGLGIEHDELKAWLLILDEDENAPLPVPEGSAPRP